MVEDDIKEVFDCLTEESIQYALLKGVEDAIPSVGGKDVDIIIRRDCVDNFEEVIKRYGFVRVLHPYDNLKDFTFLYGMNEFRFYQNHVCSLDICFQLSCRSTNNGEWVPLDLEIQRSVWENRRYDEGFKCYMLSFEDELIHLLTRLIFDGKKYNNKYANRIGILLDKVSKEVLYEKMKLVFFKFSGFLMDFLYNNQLDDISQKYIKFTEY